jgi:Transcriptional regulators
MEVNEILKMYNEDGLTLVEIAGKLSSSKSTVSRVLRDNGYEFNKELKKYILKSENNVSRETINTGNKEIGDTVNNKSIKMVKCTFDLPENLHRKMKSKCALEGVKMVDFIRRLIENSIK